MRKEDVMRGWTRLGILLSAVLALVATNHIDATAQQCPKGKLRFYTSWPMQGAMIPEGTGMKNGLDMAVAEVGGTVAGFCLEIVNLDDASPQTGKWDGAVEAENANKAVADPQAILYVGTYNSGAAKVSIPINNRAHMAQITPANTYPGLTKKQGAAPGEPDIYRPLGFPNYFRPIPADDIQGAVAAKWAKRLGIKKVFILNDQELYGKGIADVFEATAKKMGLTVVANEGIDWKQPDQKPVLTKVRASGADLVYMGGVIETGAQVIIRQMKEVGLVAPRVRFMGPDGLLEEELLKGATCEVAMATEMRVTFAGLPFEKMKGVGAKTYEEYKKKFGKEPTSYALYAAEAGRVAIDAIKRAAPAIEKGKDPTEKREALRKAIATTKNFEGINGKWSFDANGDVDYDTMSGFKVVKADTPIGCKFQFETILE
jgi:branched-chain amino acid transport system substrate-binding protein